MIMVSRGKFQVFYKKWIHFDLNQVRIIILDVEAISKMHFIHEFVKHATRE